MEGRDPRRNPPLTNWILSLPFEFTGDSAFESSSTESVHLRNFIELPGFLVKKCVTLINILATSAGVFFNPIADKYVKIMFDNANTGFAEVCVLFGVRLVSELAFEASECILSHYSHYRSESMATLASFRTDISSSLQAGK